VQGAKQQMQAAYEAVLARQMAEQEAAAAEADDDLR
jgi:hypothetical protein